MNARQLRRSNARATATMAATTEEFERKRVLSGINLSTTYGSVVYDRPDHVPEEQWVHVAELTLAGKNVQFRGASFDAPAGLIIQLRDTSGGVLGTVTVGPSGHAAIEGRGLVPTATNHANAKLEVSVLDDGHALDGVFSAESFLIRKKALKKAPTFEFSPTDNRGTFLDCVSNDPPVVIPPVVDPSQTLYSFDNAQIVLNLYQTRTLTAVTIDEPDARMQGKTAELYLAVGNSDVGAVLGTAVIQNGRYTIRPTFPITLVAGETYSIQTRIWDTEFNAGAPESLEFDGSILDTVFSTSDSRVFFTTA